MIQTAFLAWAITTNESEGRGNFYGRYYFGGVPKHMEGCVKTLFKTRREARKALSERKQGYTAFPKACVSRVKVTIEELRQD